MEQIENELPCSTSLLQAEFVDGIQEAVIVKRRMSKEEHPHD